MSWNTQKKNNKMADAGTKTAPVPAKVGPVEQFMQLLGFVKVDFASVIKPIYGAISLGLDNDGKLKIKDSYGYIFEMVTK